MMNRCRRDNYGSSEANRISFVPADLDVHAELSNVSFVRHLDLHFDAGCWVRGWCRGSIRTGCLIRI